MAGLHQLHKPNSLTSFYYDDRAHKQINRVFIVLTTLKKIYGVGMLINASMFCGFSSGTDSSVKEHECTFPTLFLGKRQKPAPTLELGGKGRIINYTGEDYTNV